MHFDLHGQSIVSITPGYEVQIAISGGYHLQAGGIVHVAAGAETTRIDPSLIGVGPEARVPEPLASLVGEPTEWADITDDGSITVELTAGQRIHVPATPSFEAWTFNGPRHRKVVSMPSGELAIWAPDPD